MFKDWRNGPYKSIITIAETFNLSPNGTVIKKKSIRKP